jgi:hypothetical protein
MIANTFKKNYFYFILIAVIIAVNIYLQILPLTNVFGYEFATVNSMLLSFLSGLLIVYLLSKNQKESNKNKNIDIGRKLILMVCIPLFISIMNSVFKGFCSFTDGLLFYTVFTLPSVIIGTALGSVAFLSIKKFRYFIFIIIYIAILFIAVLEIYFNPQVYLYNPIFAYFPGTIYDEGLTVELKLTLYRIFNLLFFLPIMFFAIRKATSSSLKSNKSFFISFTVVVLIFYFFISPLFGFTTTELLLRNHLSSKVESEHSIIYADSRIEKDDLERVTLNSEYYYSQLRNFFNVKPRSKINIYLFFDKSQKKELFGSANADVSKPWLNSVYISFDSWESTLKHELAHCFSAEFGTGIFKLAAGFNPSLIEGIAESADGFYDENNINYLASLAYKNDYRIDLSSLFSSFSFFKSVSNLSYIYSGSFINYLNSKFGIEKVKQFYRSNDFKYSFNTDLITELKNYGLFLDTLNTYGSKAETDFYFGLKPLLSKVCPRYISSRLEEAWKFYSLKSYEKAENIFSNILFKANNYSALIGLTEIYENDDSWDQAIKLLEKNLTVYSGTSNEYDLKFRLADLYIKNGDLTKAEEISQTISEIKPSRRFELLANVRISLINNGTIKDYVLGSDYDKYEILKELNINSYDYSSFLFMIEMSKRLEESYKSFLMNFKNNLDVTDETSCYAVYKLSKYMLKNSDFNNARKLASLALRYMEDPNLFTLVSEHNNKSEWFVKNAYKVLSETKFEMN